MSPLDPGIQIPAVILTCVGICFLGIFQRSPRFACLQCIAAVSMVSLLLYNVFHGYERIKAVIAYREERREEMDVLVLERGYESSCPDWAARPCPVVEACGEVLEALTPGVNKSIAALEAMPPLQTIAKRSQATEAKAEK